MTVIPTAGVTIAMALALAPGVNRTSFEADPGQVVVMSERIPPSEVLTRIEARCPHGRLDFAYSHQKYGNTPRVRELSVNGRSLTRDQIAIVEALLGTRDVRVVHALDCGELPGKPAFGIVVEFDPASDETRPMASFIVVNRRITQAHPAQNRVKSAKVMRAEIEAVFRDPTVLSGNSSCPNELLLRGSQIRSGSAVQAWRGGGQTLTDLHEEREYGFSQVLVWNDPQRPRSLELRKYQAPEIYDNLAANGSDDIPMREWAKDHSHHPVELRYRIVD